ncbi:hypothetical protein P7C71_g392, partial [Lecanoromycetidae sp. Uapishka_2]
MVSQASGPTKDTTLSACDECRARKLKCSGEPSGCSRCTVEGAGCHYSQRKTMGRPRKRRREEETDDISIRATAACESGEVAHAAFPDSNVARFVGNGLVQNDSQLSNNEFDINAWLTPDGLHSSTLENGDFEVQAAEKFVLDPMLGYATWENGQGTGNTLSNPTQLLIPPTTLDYNLIDNNLAGLTTQKTCSCLPDLYRTLASFQSVPAPSFPFSLGNLKKAARLAHDVVQCQICPQTYNTAVQNSMLLGTLMQLLINEYSKLLKHIDERSSSGQKIPFRVGEPSSPFDSRHTGGPDCPMSVSIDLSGDEWRLLARKAVHQEIYGEKAAGHQSLMALLHKMRDRQEGWHHRFTSEVHTPGHNHSDEEARKSNEHICVQVTQIHNLKKSLEMLGV